MQKLWWLEIVGFLLALTGGWRVLWRIPVLLGLAGANKLGTAKGEQVEVNKATISETLKGLPLAVTLLIVGVLLILIF